MTSIAYSSAKLNRLLLILLNYGQGMFIVCYYKRHSNDVKANTVNYREFAARKLFLPSASIL